ncbi:MAG: ATP-dependent DNA ligase [Planctomycetales bacterium]|nr:ATP-dependent DNA ligase [Planctomycetales bacterium]
MANSLVDSAKLEIKLGNYAVGSATSMPDSTAVSAAQEYRRLTASRMMPLGQEDIGDKIPSGEYHVSRKIDGEFAVLVLQDEQVFAINPGGTIRVGLPWLEEARKQLFDAGIRSAKIAGELYAHLGKRRSRVHDVSRIARSPKSESDLKKLRFAPFDIIELNGEKVEDPYGSIFQSLENLFAKCKYVTPVETQIVNDRKAISQLFHQWVEKEEAEGLVVRSDNSGLFKIKARHTLDAVVIGFTESVDERAGLLHDVLVAVMRGDDSFHVLTRVGGGFSEDQRRSLLSDLKDMTVASEYVEVNSDYVAYQMVRPEWIVEVSYLDLISQTTRGGPVNRMVIEYEAEAGYKVVRRLPLATVISPQFVRLRDDKSVNNSDVRIAQVTDRVEVALTDVDARSFDLPKSEVLKRQVFTKVLKGATMIRKFVLIKTNKEKSLDEFPAFVLHYTDFSPNRKDPLSREVLVSNSQTQIESLLYSMREENIKKGWNEV